MKSSVTEHLPFRGDQSSTVEISHETMRLKEAESGSITAGSLAVAALGNRYSSRTVSAASAPGRQSQYQVYTTEHFFSVIGTAKARNHPEACSKNVRAIYLR